MKNMKIILLATVAVFLTTVLAEANNTAAPLTSVTYDNVQKTVKVCGAMDVNHNSNAAVAGYGKDLTVNSCGTAIVQCTPFPVHIPCKTSPYSPPMVKTWNCTGGSDQSGAFNPKVPDISVTNTCIVPPPVTNLCPTSFYAGGTDYFGLDGPGNIGMGGSNEQYNHSTATYIDYSTALQVAQSNLSTDFSSQLLTILTCVPGSGTCSGLGLPAGTQNYVINGTTANVFKDIGSIESDGQDQICCNPMRYPKYRDMEKDLTLTGPPQCTGSCPLQEANGSATISSNGINSEDQAIAAAKAQADATIDTWTVSQDNKNAAHAALNLAVNGDGGNIKPLDKSFHTYINDQNMQTYLNSNGFIMLFSHGNIYQWPNDHDSPVAINPTGTFTVYIKKNICPGS